MVSPFVPRSRRRLLAVFASFALVFSISIGVAGSEPNTAVQEGRAAFDRGEYKDAMRLLAPLAVQGNADAQQAVGILYQEGWGVERDFSTAVKWIRAAADQGHAKAQVNLGWMYEKGIGVPEDFAQAFAWYRKSAEQDFPPAQLNVGAMYATGKGVPQDYAAAMKWYLKAAEQGDADAQTRVGFMLVLGQGVAKDYLAAEKWLRKGVSQGHPGSQYWLGRLYEEGWGVEKNLSEAAKWYRLATDGHIQEAPYRLGVMYAKGQGVPQDDVQARRLLQVASAAGSLEAREFLREHYARPTDATSRSAPTSHAQWSGLEDVERLKKAESLGVALAYLDAENTKLLFEATRKSGTRFFYWQAEVTPANADEFARLLERRRQISSEEMNHRGFATVAGDYDLQRDAKNECRLPPEPLGPVTISQDKSMVEFKDAAGKLSGNGVIIASSLAIKPATLSVGSIYFIGEVTHDRIEIDYLDGGQSSRCKIGALVKRGAAHAPPSVAPSVAQTDAGRAAEEARKRKADNIEMSSASSLKSVEEARKRGADNLAATRDEQAIRNSDEAIRLNPQDARAFYNRGLAYGRLGQHQRAIEDYNEAIRLNPQFALAFFHRGRAYGRLGQYQREIEDYNDAIRLNPRFALAFHNRGIAYGSLGQHQRAMCVVTVIDGVLITIFDGAGRRVREPLRLVLADFVGGHQ